MSEANEPQAQLVAVCLTAGLEVIATRCEWHDEYGWYQYHDKRDPMPTDWDDEPPQEVMQLVARTDVEALLTKKAQEADALRKAMGKKIPEEMAKQKMQFYEEIGRAHV